MAAIADPFVPWFDLWKHSTQLASSLPPFAYAGPDLFGTPGPGISSAMIESQQMLWERTVTIGEMWWTLWLSTCSPAALLSTRGWDGEAQPRLAPVSETLATPAVERAPKRARQG